MEFEQTSIVEYDEVDTAFRMKLPVLFQRLQRGALHHSESVGLGAADMLAAGAVWILNRMRVHICRLPRYRETITLRTWHKGSAGFRAGRDFLVCCGHETVAAATSRWLYYDLNRQRVAKIPPTVSAPYTAETRDVLDPGAIEFEADNAFAPQQTVPITIREGDFDPNGHVNNAIYLEYLETLVKRTGVGGGRVGQVGIQYTREIGRDVHLIQAGVTVLDSGTLRFSFFDQAAVYAGGFVTAPAAPPESSG